MAIMGIRRPGDRRGAAADAAHGVIGVGEAIELEAAAGLGDGVGDVLAQHDARAVELDLEHGALGQAQGVPHALGRVICPRSATVASICVSGVIRKIRYA
jgi:hypothetical protein